MNEKRLRAGAGKARIAFPEAYFPSQGYNGIHTDMHVRALLMECEIRVLLISVELPSIKPFELIDELRESAAQIADVPSERVWLCVTHSLGAPHTPPMEDAVHFEMHMTAVKHAIVAAVSQAVRSMRNACIGFGEGASDVIVSRDIESVDGWWIGLQGKDASDTTLSVMRLDDEAGKPIAIVYNHALKSSVLEQTVMSDGYLYASADLCGEGSRIAEEAFDAPTLFFMGAGGDQFPSRMGHHNVVGEDGHIHTVNYAEKAYDFLDELGKRLGADLITAVKAVSCTETAPRIRLEQVSVKVPGQIPYSYETNPMPPIKTYTYALDVDQVLDYAILQIGSGVIIGVKPEVTTPIMTELKQRSPFSHTMLFSMVNGGQKYLADDREFERFEFPALRTVLGRGADRLFLDKTMEALRRLL